MRTENLVHSLEHGAVWIAYNPDQVTGDALATLQKKVDGERYMVMSPYPGLDSPVSLQSWGHQLKVGDVTDPRIDEFISSLKQNQYTHPEVGASCDATGPGAFDQDNPPPFVAAPAPGTPGSQPEISADPRDRRTRRPGAVRRDPRGAHRHPLPQRRGWARPLIAVLAAVGLLLFGAAAGLLIGLPGSSATSTADRRLGGRRVRAGHVGAPPAGRPDGLLGARPHHGPRAQAARLRHRDHPAPADRPHAGLAGAVGHGGGGARRQAHGLDGRPTPTPTPTTSTGGVDTMPGMATSDQLRALRAASGEQMDVLFLQLMLRHHEGGVIMLQYASEHASVPEVRNLAAQMLSSQTSESEYLKQLLAARGGTPLPL